MGRNRNQGYACVSSLKNWMDGSSVHWSREHGGRGSFGVRKTDLFILSPLQRDS